MEFDLSNSSKGISNSRFGIIVIYLDNHATTPCDQRVVKAMLPFFDEVYGNPSSTTHSAGRTASSAIENARENIASVIGARSREIVFTGGATEANNLAILGLALESSSNRKRIVTTPIEHKSVLAPFKLLDKMGYESVQLPVHDNGLINHEGARKLITENTLLVSVQGANNEIGTIQPVAEIAAIAHDQGALVHCDAAQAVGKLPVDVDVWDVDLLSLSGHKFYGPKGIGVLYIRGGPYALPLKPLMLGGGQESELRPGTSNVPGIVGIGEAARLCIRDLAVESERIGRLRDRFEQLILDSIDKVRVNGAKERRLDGTSSLTFPQIDAEALIINTPELAISTGSACTSGAPEPSHVLIGIGLSRQDAYSTIRIGLGRFTTDVEIDQAAELIVGAVRRLRGLQAQT